jgi:hypothetical protein
MDDDTSGQSKKAEKKGSGMHGGDPMWKWGMRCGLGAFMSAFFIGFLAVPAQSLALGFGAPALSSFAYGFGTAAIILGTGLVFQQYGGWHHYNPALSIAGMLCDEGRKWSWAFIGVQFISMLMAFGGYAAAEGINWAIYDFSLFDNSTLTSQSWFPDFLNETIGLMLLVGIYLFSMRKYEGPWGIFGIALTHGLLITLYQAVNGGSFNFSRTLASGWIEGNLELTGWSSKLVATFVAPIFICFVKMLIYPEKMLSMMTSRKQ